MQAFAANRVRGDESLGVTFRTSPARSLPFPPDDSVKEQAVVRVRLALLLTILSLAALPLEPLAAQAARASSRKAACRCEPLGKRRRPRFLLPVAGVGFLPVSIAARDSQLPALDFPSLVDIRDASPLNAVEGERALAVGALAPNTATLLPTLMLAATTLLLSGGYLLVPRRRRRALSWNRGTSRRGHWRLRTIHRRRLGVAVVSSGGLLLLLGSREYAEGAQTQRRARAEWFQTAPEVNRVASVDSVVSVAAKPVRRKTLASESGRRSLIPLPEASASGTAIARGTPVARLVVASIDLDEIVLEGVGPVELNGGPGHFPGSVLPGESGNAIISAHRDRHFRRMDEVVVGTMIRTETRTETVEWVVTERRIVSRDAPALFKESEATLTLTTCWPLRYFGPAPDRLLIIAKRVSN